MKNRIIVAAALLAGTSVVGGIAATAASDTGATRRAAAQAADASKALKKHKADKAVAAAEAAVALDPRNAGYRTLLGQAYLASGRFASAAGALGDALALDPSDGTAALHLVLAQIATGEWGAARQTLAHHALAIPASDRGLALALAGDPAAGVTVLTEAARQPGADAKTRQNLALSLALAGRWNEAKTIAAFDMAPAEVDQRIMQWASFAQPKGAADQVAALLGVVPVEDGGQPERLALRTTAPAVAAVAQTVAPAETFQQTVEPASPVAVTQVADSLPAVVEPAAPTQVRFAPRGEVVQAIPAVAPRVANISRAAPVRPSPAPVAAAASHAPAKGNFYVQLGAYESAGVAKDAWGRLSRRFALGAFAPNGGQVSANGASFYRLSIGGFARGDADALCRKLRRSGGKCFVRVGAGDQMAAWSRGVQYAAR